MFRLNYTILPLISWVLTLTREHSTFLPESSAAGPKMLAGMGINPWRRSRRSSAAIAGRSSGSFPDEIGWRKRCPRQTDGGERSAVIRAGGHDRCIDRLGEEAVHEIDVAAAGDAPKQRALRPDDFQLVPADLRNLQAVLLRKPHHPARKNAQPGSATVELLAPLKQRLVTHADAQKRPARLDEFPEVPSKPCFPSACMQSSNAPTPGSTTARASAISWRAWTIRTSAPTLSSALCTLRRFPEP